MPKMSHAIEGWSEHSTLPTATLAHSGCDMPAGRHRPTRLPDQPGLWKYERVTRSPLAMGLAILVSLGLHVFVLLGFNHRPPPVRPVLVDDGPLIQMTMPDLEDEKEKPVDSLDDTEAVETPAIAVPMLVDVPTIVPVSAFVQPLDFTPALNVDPNAVRLSAVPVNIARGSGTAAKIGKIFDVSQLDRQPQAIFQPPPVFPADLRREYPECTVVVGFIITAKGEVTAPYIISSQVRRFEEAALTGVLKWKFKPGFRGGRAVNTRTQIAISFRVSDGE
jgi:periplasmic protein TonB